MATDISQTNIATAKPVGQLLMIDPQQMQHRRMQIMHLERVLSGPIPPFIRRSIRSARPHPAARQPNTETKFIVVTTVRTLGKWRAPEFTGKQNQRGIQ